MRLKLVDVCACLVNCKVLCTVGWFLEVIYSGEQQKDPLFTPRPQCSCSRLLSQDLP